MYIYIYILYIVYCYYICWRYWDCSCYIAITIAPAMDTACAEGMGPTAQVPAEALLEIVCTGERGRMDDSPDVGVAGTVARAARCVCGGEWEATR